MKFDVIIGNPPYQLNDGGGDGNSAAPIYHHFITQAKKLNPRYISMIVPARWYSGGKGLDEFRSEMLKDDRLSVLHDFPETSDCFPGLNIRGGVCYFLWDREHHGNCRIFNHKQNVITEDLRPLLEPNTETFIRYNAAITIIRKVKSFNEETMDNRVSSRLPFGIPSNFAGFSIQKDAKNNIVLYRSDRGNSKTANKRVFVSSDSILKNIEWKDKLKVIVSKASPGGDEYPHSVITTPILAERNSVCTETYLIVDFVDSEELGENLISYMRTRFFRFMMALIKNTQNISKGVFAFVPVQDISKTWSDEDLYAKYGLNDEEIAFIESMIRPMDLGGDDNAE
jgi:site-specific DNA-methyltransferase (adenine-specific)